MKNWSTVKRSLRLQLILSLLVILIPSNLLILYTYNYASDIVYKQASSPFAAMLKQQQQQIDDSLDAIDIYFDYIIGLNNNLVNYQNPRSEKEYTLSKIWIANTFSNDLTLLKNIDFFYLYTPDQDDLTQIFKNNSISNQYRPLVPRLKDLFEKHSNNPTLYYNWSLENMDGKYYLIKAYTSSNMELGACIDIENILPNSSEINFGKNSLFFFTNNHAEILAKTPNIEVDFQIPSLFPDGQNHAQINVKGPIVLGCLSKTELFSLGAVIAPEHIYASLPSVIRFGRLEITAVIILIPLFILILAQRLVMRPLVEVVNAMKKAGQGEMNVRLDVKATTSEFSVVNKSFNSMLEQITELQVNTYKEKIHRQRAELHHLKLQLNPHFLLNSLNIVYTLIKRQRAEIALETTMCLIKHFRFILRKNEIFVLLGDEIEFIKNYLRLQQLQHPGNVEYEINMAEHLAIYRIPQLMLENFVENTVKYAYNPEYVLKIAINISFKEDEYHNKLLYCDLADSGPGFSEEFLALAGHSEVSSIKNAHIGIYNIIRRLEIIYKGNAKIEFSNIEPQGARIQILIPTNETYIDNVDLEYLD